jgi:DNA replication protein DnaC
MPKNTIAKPSERAAGCTICGGSGWRQVLQGNAQQVTRCDCFLETQSAHLLTTSDIPSRYTECDFARYRTDTGPMLAAAKITMEKWAAQYPLDRTGLLLVGPSGVGKTHLSVAALKQLMKKGVHCRFCDYRELLKQIQNSYNPSVQATELEVLKPVFESDVLLLDDLGAVKPSEWVWDTVSLVLNNRYNDNRTTIITTNFMDGPAAAAEKFDGPRRANREETLGDRIGERMRSRLFEMCRLVQVQGKDYRPNFRSASFG